MVSETTAIWWMIQTDNDFVMKMAQMGQQRLEFQLNILFKNLSMKKTGKSWGILQKDDIVSWSS